MSLAIYTPTVMAHVYRQPEPYAVVTVKPEYDLNDAMDVMSRLLTMASPEDLREPRAFFGEADPGGCLSLGLEDSGDYSMFVAIDELLEWDDEERVTSTASDEEWAAIRAAWGF